jgi:hypothetical protein
MKKFSQVQKKSTRIFEAEEKYEDMSKEELIKLMSVKKDESEKEKADESGDEKSEKSSDVVKFFSRLFESREMAHVYHLTVKGEMGSHAAHLALQEYYEGILEFVDEMIEVYQGQYGIIEGYDVIDTSDTKNKDKIEYFEDLVSQTREDRKCIKSEDTHIHNIIDEAIALMFKTLYKLKYNK